MQLSFGATVELLRRSTDGKIVLLSGRIGEGKTAAIIKAFGGKKIAHVSAPTWLPALLDPAIEVLVIDDVFGPEVLDPDVIAHAASNPKLQVIVLIGPEREHLLSAASRCDHGRIVEFTLVQDEAEFLAYLEAQGGGQPSWVADFLRENPDLLRGEAS